MLEYKNGQPAVIRNFDGGQVQLQYSPEGLVRHVDMPNGLALDFAYEKGRVSRVKCGKAYRCELGYIGRPRHEVHVPAGRASPPGPEKPDLLLGGIPRLKGNVMQNNLIGMLGMPLDEIAQSAFIRSLTDNPNVEQIHDSLHMTLPASGVEFTAEIDGGVSAIHIHAEAFQGYRGFQGDLPEGIKFSDSRKTIQDKLGKPSASDTGAVVAFFGKALQWDRFDRADHILHIQYADDGRQ